MSLALNVGDVVFLSSGSPFMTVESVANGSATCIWFNQTTALSNSKGGMTPIFEPEAHKHSFPVAMLTKKP